MWACTGQSIQMVEGDFGIELPLSVNGVTFTEHDDLRIKIAQGEDVLITKTFSNITNNTVQLVLSEAESALLPIGAYQYSLDWFQDGAFMCNVIQRASFKVVDKL